MIWKVLHVGQSLLPLGPMALSSMGRLLGQCRVFRAPCGQDAGYSLQKNVRVHRSIQPIWKVVSMSLRLVNKSQLHLRKSPKLDSWSSSLPQEGRCIKAFLSLHGSDLVWPSTSRVMSRGLQLPAPHPTKANEKTPIYFSGPRLSSHLTAQ